MNKKEKLTDGVKVSKASLNKTKSGTNKKSATLKNNTQVFDNTGLQGKRAKVLKRDNTGKLLVGLSAISLVLVMVVVGQFFVLESEDPSNVLHSQTYINGVNVGGLSSAEAEQVVYNVFKEKSENFNLNIKYKDKSWKFTKDDFEVNSQIHTIIEEAQTRNALLNNYSEQTNKLKELEKEGVSINVAFNYIFVGLDSKIEKIISEIEVKPTNSEIIFNPEKENCFEITEHKNGLRVNKEQLYFDINQQFNKTNNLEVEISMLDVEPEITKQANQQKTQLIASYSTQVADSTGNRKKNVRLALERFNGKVVNSGEEVSFNAVTGPHTLENGYKNATVIYNGQFVDGVGGGVCQASTTLYNALLLADVEVLEVHKHTLPVKYVPLGLDAMVSDYVADLKFKNNYENPIYIQTLCDSEKVEVKLYGVETGKTIKTRSETVATLPHLGDKIISDEKGEYSDKVLFKGEKYRLTYPREGYEAKAYVEYYENGKLVSEKLIRHEFYNPQNGIVIEGAQDVLAGMNIIESDVEARDSFNESDMNNMHQNFIPTNVCP